MRAVVQENVHVRSTMANSYVKKTGPSQEEDNLTFLIYSLPLILACVCYANGLTGDFVHDDVFAIQRNPDVTGQTSIFNVFKNDFWGRQMDNPNSHKSYRPLCILTFRWNYQFGEGNPYWFHVVNLVLHLCVTCAMTHVCLQVLRVSQMCALLASSLFAVHPIHTEAVTGIVGRADLLASLAVLGSFYLYAKCITSSSSSLYNKDINDNSIPPRGVATSRSLLSPTQMVPLLASLVLAVVATLFKETGVTVLGISLLYDVLLHRKELKTFKTCRNLSGTLKTFLLRCGCLVVTGLAILVFRLWMNSFKEPKFLEEDNPASFSPHFLTRVLTYSYLIPFNLWLLLCPNILSYDWQGDSIPLVETLLDGRNLVTLLVVVSAMWMFSKVRDALSSEELDDKKNQETTKSGETSVPSWCMAIVFLCVPFLPASNLFLRVGFVVAERILYLPSMGFCLMVAHGLDGISARYPTLKAHMLTAFVLLTLSFGVRTCVRNKDWQSRHALFWSGVQTLPHNAKVHYNFANYLRDINDSPRAEDHYRRAISLNPNHPSYYNNLGTILTNYSEAEQLFRKTLDLRPDHKLAMVNLGNLLLERGNHSGVTYFHSALRVDPTYVDALLSLGRYMLDRGQLDQAKLYLRQARDLRPDLPDVHTYYGALFQKTGQDEEALKEFKQAFALNSNHLATVKSAAKSLRHLRRYDEAERMLKQAITLASDSDIYSQLGLLYSEMGQTVDALFAYKRSLALSPNDTLTHLRYLKILEETHQFTEVKRGLDQLLHRVPHSVEVLEFAFIFLQRQGEHNEALHYLQEAIVQAELQDHSHLSVFYHDMGNIYRQSGNMEKALQFFQASLKIDSSYMHSHVNLGAIYHLQKKYELAETHYLKALELDPTNELCKQNLERLKKLWQKPSKLDKLKT